jgi:hypothetical protein
MDVGQNLEKQNDRWWGETRGEKSFVRGIRWRPLPGEAQEAQAGLCSLEEDHWSPLCGQLRGSLVMLCLGARMASW